MHSAIVLSWFVGECGEIRLKLDVRSQGGGKILDVDGQVDGGFWKLSNF